MKYPLFNFLNKLKVNVMRFILCAVVFIVGCGQGASTHSDKHKVSRTGGDKKAFISEGLENSKNGNAIQTAPEKNIDWDVGYSSRPLESPSTTFRSITGLEMDKTWQVVESGELSVGFMGDGEIFIILKLPQKGIDSLLAKDAPWEDGWHTGPIPHKIGLFAQFGTEGVGGYGSQNGGPLEYSKYFGDQDLVKLFESTHIKYAAKDRATKSHPWYNGQLLIVDPKTRKVWLSYWDN